MCFSAGRNNSVFYTMKHQHLDGLEKQTADYEQPTFLPEPQKKCMYEVQRHFFQFVENITCFGHIKSHHWTSIKGIKCLQTISSVRERCERTTHSHLFLVFIFVLLILFLSFQEAVVVTVVLKTDGHTNTVCLSIFLSLPKHTFSFISPLFN